LKLGHEQYWSFLKACEDTGLQRMDDFVKQEQDKWIARYDESMASYQAQQAANSSESRSRLLLEEMILMM
jgi:hypothetical protein